MNMNDTFPYKETKASISGGNMLGYLSTDIICSEKCRSRKTVRFSEQIMSAEREGKREMTEPAGSDGKGVPPRAFFTPSPQLPNYLPTRSRPVRKRPVRGETEKYIA